MNISNSISSKSHRPIPTLVGVLLLAAFLRLFRLTALGLEHDEVANWLIDRSILAGNHGIYFQEAYGHEAGFHYLQTLCVALIGDNALALRLPAALLGVLVVAVSYRLVKTLYNHPVALTSTLIIAITFFPTFYSRLALRAIMLPIFSGLSGYFFWRGIRREKWKVESGKQKGLILNSQFTIHNLPFIISAILAGLSAYTYMASRVVPIFFGLFFAVWLIFYPWSVVRRPWAKIIQWMLLYTAIAAPLFMWLQLNPGSEFRISEINQPLVALQNGDPMPALQNAWRIFGVWGWSGDPLWRQNVAGAAIFNPITAILFYAGVVLMLWRRRWADVFVLLWLATATIPSIVTADAPSTIRMINMLPVLGVPIAIVIHRLSTLSTDNPQLSTGFGRKSWITALTIVFLLGSARTFNYLHSVWPNGGDVPFVWQQSLTSAARWLDDQPNALPTTILGWSSDTMDPPTMELALNRDDIPLRFAGQDNGVSALVLPFGSGDVVRVIRPNNPSVNLAQPLVDFLDMRNETQQASFAAYYVGMLDDFALLSSYAMPFGDELVLTTIPNCDQTGSSCTFRTVWVINTPSGESRSIFIHALDADGNILTQSDVQLPAPTYWKTGDHVVAAHTLSDTSFTSLRIGIYDPQTGQRLLAGGDDHLLFSFEE